MTVGICRIPRFSLAIPQLPVAALPSHRICGSFLYDGLGLTVQAVLCRIPREMNHADDALLHNSESTSPHLQMLTQGKKKKKTLISREVAEHKLEPCDFLFKHLFPTPVQMAAHIQGSPYYFEKKMRSHSKCL